MNAQLITQQTLEDADIDLTGEDVVALLAYLNEMVEERISTKITDSLSDEQVQTMLELQKSSTEAQLAAWMEKNVPKMAILVQSEVDLLIDEIIETDDTEEE